MFRSCCLLPFLLLVRLAAAEYYVAQATGDDAAAGTPANPFKTIARAVKALQPGDTLHLVPGEAAWPQLADLYKMPSGEPGRPIVIDGHGVWLTGADPCPADGWQEQPDGVWTHRGMAYSGCLIVAGRLCFETLPTEALRPGEFCWLEAPVPRLFLKTGGTPLPAIAVGQPGGASVTLDPKAWQSSGLHQILRYNGLKPPTWIKAGGVETPLLDVRTRLEPGQFCVQNRVLCFRPPAGQTPLALAVAAVVRGNGIQFGGDTHDVIVRNFNVRHVFNDGYNVHGAVKRIEFWNCNARDCGDEGFSSHDDCETLLDGAVYVNCDNGINNVGRAKSVSRHVLCARSRHNGYEGQQESEHRLEDAILIDNPCQLAGGSARIAASNVLLLRTAAGPRNQAIGSGGTMTLSQVTAVGNSNLIWLSGNFSLKLEASLLGPDQGAFHVRHEAPATVCRLERVRVAAGYTLEFGGRQPFQRQPLADWLQAANLPDVAVADLGGLAQLTRGELPQGLPEGLGCSRDLLERACRFLADERRQD